MERSIRRLTRLLAPAVAVVLAAALAPGPAQAAPGLATHIEFTGVFTPGFVLPDTPGAPDIHVAENRDFSVTADFVDDNGQKRAAYLLPARATLYVDGRSTPIATKLVAASAKSVRFDGLRLPEQNNIRLRMTLTTLLGILVPVRQGFSDYFDVQRAMVRLPFDSNPSGFGNGGGEDNPCEAPFGGFCADLILAHAAGVLSDQFGSFGFCEEGDECVTGEYFQAVVALDGSVYNRANPFRIVLKCHPSVCDPIIADRRGEEGPPPAAFTFGGGDYPDYPYYPPPNIDFLGISASLSPDGPMIEAQPCTYDNQVPEGEDFCRSNDSFTNPHTGVHHLVLLARDDIRGSVR